MDGEWRYAKDQALVDDSGCCVEGCGEGTCHWSWPKRELEENNPKAMYRCKPKEAVQMLGYGGY